MLTDPHCYRRGNFVLHSVAESGVYFPDNMGETPSYCGVAVPSVTDFEPVFIATNCSFLFTVIGD